MANHSKRKKDGSGKFAPRAKDPDRGMRGAKLKGCVPVYMVIHKRGPSFMDWDEIAAFTEVGPADHFVENDTNLWRRPLVVQRRLYTKIDGRWHRVNATHLKIPIHGLPEEKGNNGTDSGKPAEETAQGDVQGDERGNSSGEGGSQSSEASTSQLPALLRSPVVSGSSVSDVQGEGDGSGDEVLRDSRISST